MWRLNLIQSKDVGYLTQLTWTITTSCTQGSEWHVSCAHTRAWKMGWKTWWKLWREPECNTRVKWTWCQNCTAGGISGHSQNGTWEIGFISRILENLLQSWSSTCFSSELRCIYNCAIRVSRKAEFMCEERSDGIPKLLEFFWHCKMWMSTFKQVL
jgi:hypothetical protein